MVMMMPARKQLLTRPPELSGSLTSRVIWEQVGETDEGVRIILSGSEIFQEISTCRKISRRGASGFASHPKESVLRIFIALKNTSPRQDFEPTTLGYSGKHTNHFTTEATWKGK
jgi:hypothetical protein